MKLKRFLALIDPDPGVTFASELSKVQKSVNPHTKKIEINKKGHHSDVSESFRYMHHGARHFTSKAPKPPETVMERRMRIHLEEQRSEEDPFA